jgi:hypothetical protein
VAFSLLRFKTLGVLWHIWGRRGIIDFEGEGAPTRRMVQVMKVVAKYRQYANAYREMAARAPRQDDRESFEAIAAAWEELADLRQRNLSEDN